MLVKLLTVMEADSPGGTVKMGVVTPFMSSPASHAFVNPKFSTRMVPLIIKFVVFSQIDIAAVPSVIATVVQTASLTLPEFEQQPNFAKIITPIVFLHVHSIVCSPFLVLGDKSFRSTLKNIASFFHKNEVAIQSFLSLHPPA